MPVQAGNFRKGKQVPSMSASTQYYKRIRASLSPSASYIRVILLIFIQNFVVISLLVVIKMSANLLSSNAGVSPIRFAETSDKTPHPGRLYISICLCIWIFGLLDLRSQLVTHARTHVLTDVRRGFSNPLYV